jgi:hypothetical protein
MAALDRDNCPLLAVRKDIEAAGRLSTEYVNRPYVTPYFPVHYVLVTNSVTNVNLAKNVIYQNREKYVELCESSLLYKDISVSLGENSSFYELTIPTKANSISVIELTQSTPASSNIEALSPGIPIYPNPVREILHVNNPDFKVVSFAVLNSIGHLCLTGPVWDNQIDVSGLDPGYYIVSLIKDDGEVLNSNFIKEV